MNEVVQKPTKKSLSSRFWVRKCIEYCHRTDLHGYKYIVMKDLHVLERLFWAIATFLSLGFSICLVITAYNWYARNPIVTVIESTQGAIWDIPFPAVTICSLNVVSRRAARFLSHNLTLPENVTADEVFETLRLVPLLHSTFTSPAHQRIALRKLQYVLDMNYISIESLFKMLSPARTCSMILERCMWKNTVFRCDDLFESLFTEFGLCCTFNYFAVDMGFKSKTVWPRRVASCGYQTALSVLVNTDPADYYSASLASKGAVVLIDNSYNIPNVDSPIRLVNPTTEVLLALSPERTYTTPGVKMFKPQERQCFYNKEIKIGYFREYSFHNCIHFQRIEIIKNACDCIPLFFPLNVEHSSHDKVNGKSSPLTCLPECEHYNYPVEVAFGKLALNIKLQGTPLFDDINLENYSVVNVFFNDLVSTRYRRDVYLNWQNLLASFGGLLGLMLGFTLIAGFDLIIFFTFGIAYGSLKEAKETKQSTVRPLMVVNNYQVREGSYTSKDINKQIVIGWNEPFEEKWKTKEYGKIKKPFRY